MADQGGTLFREAAAADILEYYVPEDIRDELQIPEGEHIDLFQLYGRADEDLPGPQAFLAETPEKLRAGAHFHPTDQFQIFFGGSGAWYQRSPIDSILFHYADAYVTYGPFGTEGPAPIRLYTLRASSTMVTAYMPRDRAQLIRRGKRNYHTDIGPLLSGSLEPGTQEVDMLIAPEGDGLGAYLMRGGPEAIIKPPAPSAASIGQYYCVVAGSALEGDAEIKQAGLAWSTGETFPIRAGSDGVAVVAMHFPAVNEGTPNLLSA